MSFISVPFFYRGQPGSASPVPAAFGEAADTIQPGMRPNGRRSRSVAVARPEPDPIYGPDEEIGEERGVVKFFDPAKGFGFVFSLETGDEVFLPGSVLKAKGLLTIAPGSAVVFEAEDTDAAPRIVEIVSVDQSTATGPALAPPPVGSVGASPLVRSKGVVDNWKTEKGFGFVRAENGDNVFVHVSACGGVPLVPGADVRIEYKAEPKGHVATSAAPV